MDSSKQEIFDKLNTVLTKRGRGCPPLHEKLGWVLLYLYSCATETCSGKFQVLRSDLTRDGILISGKNANRRQLLHRLNTGAKVSNLGLISIQPQSGGGIYVESVLLLFNNVCLALSELGRKFGVDMSAFARQALKINDDIPQQEKSSVAGILPTEKVKPPKELQTVSRCFVSSADRPMMPRVVFENGRDAHGRNVAKVFEELSRVARDGEVLGSQIGKQTISFRDCLKELSRASCIEIVRERGGRGRPGVAKIRLLERPAVSVREKIFRNTPRETQKAEDCLGGRARRASARAKGKRKRT